MLVRYALERLLYRRSKSAHGGEFILKGAMLFTIGSKHPHRATKDLDLLGAGAPDLDRLAQVFRDVCAASVEDDGVWMTGPGKGSSVGSSIVIGGGTAESPKPTSTCTASWAEPSLLRRENSLSSKRLVAAPEEGDLGDDGKVEGIRGAGVQHRVPQHVGVDFEVLAERVAWGVDSPCRKRDCLRGVGRCAARPLLEAVVPRDGEQPGGCPRETRRCD